MKRALVPFFVMSILFAQALHGVVPQKWEIRNKDDFLRGKLSGISVSYDGVLSLSPKEEPVEAPVEDFYLSLLLTPQGEIFLGTGHAGKIYKISKSGKVELYFQVPEMDVLCLARDRKGNLYAGTSPNGKIYKSQKKVKADLSSIPAKNTSGTCFLLNGEFCWLRSVRAAGFIRSTWKEKEYRF